jgi:hypothetical protein
VMVGWKVRGSNRSRGNRILSSPNCPDQLCCPQSLLCIGTWDSFTGVKQLGHEVDNLPPPSAEVKNQCDYTSTPIT